MNTTTLLTVFLTILGFLLALIVLAIFIGYMVRERKPEKPLPGFWSHMGNSISKRSTYFGYSWGLPLWTWIILVAVAIWVLISYSPSFREYTKELVIVGCVILIIIAALVKPKMPRTVEFETKKHLELKTEKKARKSIVEIFFDFLSVISRTIWTLAKIAIGLVLLAALIRWLIVPIPAVNNWLLGFGIDLKVKPYKSISIPPQQPRVQTQQHTPAPPVDGVITIYKDRWSDPFHPPVGRWLRFNWEVFPKDVVLDICFNGTEVIRLPAVGDPQWNNELRRANIHSVQFQIVGAPAGTPDSLTLGYHYTNR